MDIIVQIFTCVVGTLAFAITMKAPKKAMKYITIGALITASIERIFSLYTNDFSACFTAMLLLSVYCEFSARIIKEPTTITLIPSTIPLLPGSAIYYTMLSLINSDVNKAYGYAKSTIFAGLGIALGAIAGTIIFKIVLSMKRLSSRH